ncbi:hypothetical protein LPJ68_005916 [Coemansia sp. RSA 1086]|nr:hypothetical protein LPJ68_005916 [Coemansia sp. RSA 1086]
MGEFSGVYPGASDAGMHLPPIDAATGLSRQSSYFGMATSPGTFDPMAAMAGPYSPHPHSMPSHYMAQGMAARGPQHAQQPYTPPMMLGGRIGLGMTQGAMPTPPPPQTAPVSQAFSHSMPAGMASTATSVPSTPTRPLPMGRVNSHHGQSSQRKRYLCTVCQKMFARPSTLATHMHSHTGEKPYECTWDGCGKRFSVMSNLRRHQRIHERQRSKFADMQKQPKPSADGESSGSTTPLASQMLSHGSLGTHVLPPPLATQFTPGQMPVDMHSPMVMPPLSHHMMSPHPHHHPQNMLPASTQDSVSSALAAMSSNELAAVSNTQNSQDQ